MELILTILAAALGRVLGSNLEEWLPWMVERLVRAAVRVLPPELRERYSEEWRASIGETPGSLAKLAVGLGFLVSSGRWTLEKIGGRHVGKIRSLRIPAPRIGARIRQWLHREELEIVAAVANLPTLTPRQVKVIKDTLYYQQAYDSAWAGVEAAVVDRVLAGHSISLFEMRRLITAVHWSRKVPPGRRPTSLLHPVERFRKGCTPLDNAAFEAVYGKLLSVLEGMEARGGATGPPPETAGAPASP